MEKKKTLSAMDLPQHYLHHLFQSAASLPVFLTAHPQMEKKKKTHLLTTVDERN